MIIGKKLGMSTIFSSTGNVLPITLIESSPNPIVEKKTVEKHGYNALKLAFLKTKANKLTKPEAGVFKKKNMDCYKILHEFRVDDITKFDGIEYLDITQFKEGERVDITGRTKGKGFQGVVKRYGWKGGPASHGALQIHRSLGSTGQHTFPARVLKGHGMPGRMGGELKTVKNLKIVYLDYEKNLIAVQGAVPGPTNGIVFIKKSKQ